MSVFRVALNNVGQGQLDVNPLTGLQFDPSIQRTVYVMGPNRINRLLSDGDTFTDCNYWKQFSVAGGAADDLAFVELVSDDGSIWADGASSNIVDSSTLTGAAGSVYATAGNEWDIEGDYPGAYAVYTRIINTAASGTVSIQLNDAATFSLDGGSEMVFDIGDLSVTKVAVQNNGSGAVASPIEVIALVKSVCNT
jgi:hypothetical protein